MCEYHVIRVIMVIRIIRHIQELIGRVMQTRHQLYKIERIRNGHCCIDLRFRPPLSQVFHHHICPHREADAHQLSLGISLS